MEIQPNSESFRNRSNAKSKGPQWWTEKHTSAWERVKDALERDWEQTKSDFSSSGHNLKQDAGDTVKQAFGSEPVPPLSVRTHPLDRGDVEKARTNLDREQADAARIIADARTNIQAEHDKLSDTISEANQSAMDARTDDDHGVEARADASKKIAKATERASEDVSKENKRIGEAVAKRAEATRNWTEAEAEVRYGFGARMQYPATQQWDEPVENNLRGEWNTLGTGRTWDQSRNEIRRGWNYGSREF